MRRDKIVVTGGAGFIGSILVKRLVELEYDVVVVDNFSTGKMENLESVKKRIRVMKADIRFPLKLKLNSVGCVFHLAALPRIGPSVIDPIETHKVNVTGTLN